MIGRPLDRVHRLLLTTRASRAVPAWLRWVGWVGWDACPPPACHVTALRSWLGRSGAEVVGMDGGTMDVRVAHRRESRDAALAREQHRYAPDVVD